MVGLQSACVFTVVRTSLSVALLGSVFVLVWRISTCLYGCYFKSNAFDLMSSDTCVVMVYCVWGYVLHWISSS